MVQISNNPVWSPKRAGGPIVYANIGVLRTLSASEDTHTNLVWPDEGSFLGFGDESIFRFLDGRMINGIPPVPLICMKENAAVILRLYDEAGAAASQEKVAKMVATSRTQFARVFDAAFMYVRSQPGFTP